ncbi:MAG TPA: hybrid sensor histidine kinase/response regulator [Vicinamibacteria bacterium]|jgi:nitrogen-specific signal transduction histidine kinase/CheY-like chemotaxis protein
MQRDRPRTSISEEDVEKADAPRLERALAQAQAACRARDELLSIAAHALRTPLTAILGWVTLLRAGELDQHTSARAIDVIERNARRQADLIADLIDATRILSGRLRLNRTRVDLRRIVDGALGATRAAADAKELRLHATVDPAAATVWGDADRIQQVVAILLANAVKFSQPRGRIDVHLERVAGGAVLRVRDEGVGIPAAVLPHLFDRLPHGTGRREKDRSRGQLGLGLSIARHLAELHGGALSAASEGTGCGATFTLRLPLRGAEAEAETAPADMPGPDGAANLEGLRVLIVGDEGEARDDMARELAARDAAVCTASSSEEAMRQLSAFAPDAMVVDLDMRGEGGYEFIGRARALGAVEGGRTPAVALTQLGRPEDRLRTLRAGFQIHVTKPVPPVELATVVARLGARPSMPSPEEGEGGGG